MSAALRGPARRCRCLHGPARRRPLPSAVRSALPGVVFRPDPTAILPQDRHVATAGQSSGHRRPVSHPSRPGSAALVPTVGRIADVHRRPAARSEL